MPLYSITLQDDFTIKNPSLHQTTCSSTIPIHHLFLFTRHKSTTTNDKLTSPVDEVSYLQAAQENKIAKLAGHHEYQQSQLDTRDIDQTVLQQMDKKVKHCPDYVTYSQHRHPPFSKGGQSTHI